METQLFIAGKFEYLSSEEVKALASQTEQLAKTLNALLNVVKENPQKEESEKKNSKVAWGTKRELVSHQLPTASQPLRFKLRCFRET